MAASDGIISSLYSVASDAFNGAASAATSAKEFASDSASQLTMMWEVIDTVSNVIFVAAISYGFLKVPRSLMVPFAFGLLLFGTTGALAYASKLIMSLISLAAALPATFVAFLCVSRFVSWRLLNRVGAWLGLDKDGDGDIDPIDLLLLFAHSRVGAPMISALGLTAHLPQSLGTPQAVSTGTGQPATATEAVAALRTDARTLQSRIDDLEKLIDTQRKEEYERGYKDGREAATKPHAE